MTDRPPSRKTHITRVYGTNKKGEILPDMYADVERMDVIKSRTQTTEAQSQGVVRRLRWCDDPTKDDYDPKGNKNRKTEVLKVCDPEATEDVNDPDEWIPIRVIKSVKSTGGNGRGEEYQDNFLNEAVQSARVAKVRRVVGYATNIDRVAERAVDADPDLREYVVSSEQYTKDIETKDKGQYVEVEIPLSLRHRGNSLSVDVQARKTKLLNDYLIEESEPAKLTVRGNNDLNPPYRLDPFQNIVNINWGGLAVKFYERESHATLATLVPDTRKFTQSIWFRAPTKSVEAAKAEYIAWRDGPGAPRPLLCGIVPIMVSGPPTKQKQVNASGGETRTIGLTHSQDYLRSFGGIYTPTGSLVDHDNTVTLPAFTGETETVDPSYIGIDCTGDYPQLSINIVMPRGDAPTYEGTSAFGLGTTNNIPDGGLYLGSVGDGVLITDGPLAPNDDWYSDALDTTADIYLGQIPETYRTLQARRADAPFDNSDPDYNGQRVTPDHWHHLLLSLDVSEPVKTAGAFIVQEAISPPEGPAVGYTIISGSLATRETVGSRSSSVSKMYLAFDDVSLTRGELSCYHPQGHSDPNAIGPVNAYTVATDTAYDSTATSPINFGRIQTIRSVGAQGRYEYRPSGIPFAGGEDQDGFGFPTTGAYVDAVKEIELGEYQLFLGSALDTGVEENRRAFITDEGKPAALSKAAELVGRKPSVLVHGSGNWKKARDTGAIAAAAEPPSPEGTHDGRIETYRPNPSLHGEQGE
ncbi:hypothetical protein N2603_23325 [Bradyrhizobium huanghuaihaiense]|uniref:hypothetical protein n=1 Tax=Bradyrhizobium huanghuaihaiense TaxID=990078 RepID=UPI0021AA3DBB|nr:hypothetical protein [Bradyrhizobium sp. CB3035]UWU73038.1 hypothetical protein N2603_23325 [Bradyrhizobium sp. CB3035]